MPDVAEQPAKPLRTWQPMAAWMAGILLALGLFWLVTKAWEIRTTRKVLSHQNPPKETLDEFGGPQRALPRLRTYLRIGDSLAPEKVTAVWALSGCGPAAVPDLLTLLRHRRTELRSTAGYALGRINPAAVEAVPALADALGDPEERVRAAAAMALGQIGSGAPEVVPVDRLIAALKEPSGNVRANAAEALGRIRCRAPAALTALVEAISDSNRDVQNSAGVALISIAPPAREIMPALMATPRDLHHFGFVHMAAWVALRIDPTAREMAPALAARFRQHDDDYVPLVQLVRAEFANLGPQGRPAVSALVTQLKDESAFVRAAFLDIITEIRPPPREALAALIRSLGDPEPWVRTKPELFLRTLGPRSSDCVPGFIEVLKDEDWALRAAAADAMGCIGSEAKAAIPALNEALRDGEPRVRSAAAEALKKIRGEEAPK